MRLADPRVEVRQIGRRPATAIGYDLHRDGIGISQGRPEHGGRRQGKSNFLGSLAQPRPPCGSVIRNTAPLPAAGSSSTVPPMAAAIARVIGRPSPVPPSARAVVKK